MGSDRSNGGFMIKICGITNRDDALEAVDSGADTLGFNFFKPSPRYINPEVAARIFEELPEAVRIVSVTVVRAGEVLEELKELNRQMPQLDMHQLHGLHRASEVPAFDKDLLIATSPEEAELFPEQEILIDTSWGRGLKGDWEQFRRLERRFVLSGGLDPENVGEAIGRLDPLGVDVCSGVERSPGLKDRNKVRRFIENVRKAMNDPGRQESGE